MGAAVDTVVPKHSFVPSRLPTSPCRILGILPDRVHVRWLRPPFAQPSCCVGTIGEGVACSASRTAVAPRAPARHSLIAAPVVARDPGHDLLRVASSDLGEELDRCPPPQDGRHPAVMRDHDIPVLALGPLEPFRLSHPVHCSRNRSDRPPTVSLVSAGFGGRSGDVSPSMLPLRLAQGGWVPPLELAFCLLSSRGSIHTVAVRHLVDEERDDRNHTENRRAR